MNTRAALTLAVIAGTAVAAHAQELIRVTYSWQEVQANTTIPVSNPNSVCGPGEGARISINIQALINGANAVGQTTNFLPPPPPGNGTVRGIASMIYNLRGNFGSASAAGTWGPRSIASVLSAGNFTGTPLLGGALLDSFGGGQFVAPGGTGNSTNPILNAFRGVWTPNSYNSDVTFRVEPGTAAPGPSAQYPFGQHNGLLVAFGISQPDPNDPTTWYDNYLAKYVDTDFGNGLFIRIIPAPSSAALLALGLLATGRRRRTLGACQ